jgi:hypothetical protein
MKHHVFPALTRHVTLLRTFSVLSLLILTVIAALLAWRLQGVVERIALKQEATLAQGQAEALLRADLLPHSASGRLTTKTLGGLAAYTQHNMHYGLFVRVKIWSPNGTILYSDARSAIGKHFPIDDDLADILSGTKGVYPERGLHAPPPSIMNADKTRRTTIPGAEGGRV